MVCEVRVFALCGMCVWCLSYVFVVVVRCVCVWCVVYMCGMCGV